MRQNNNNNDDIKWLYGKFKAKGYNIGSEQEFTTSLDNEEDRRWYYDKARGMGLNVGSQADFDNLFVHSEPTTAESPVDSVAAAPAEAPARASDVADITNGSNRSVSEAGSHRADSHTAGMLTYGMGGVDLSKRRDVFAKPMAAGAGVPYRQDVVMVQPSGKSFENTPEKEAEVDRVMAKTNAIHSQSAEAARKAKHHAEMSGKERLAEMRQAAKDYAIPHAYKDADRAVKEAIAADDKAGKAFDENGVVYGSTYARATARKASGYGDLDKITESAFENMNAEDREALISSYEKYYTDHPEEGALPMLSARIKAEMAVKDDLRAKVNEKYGQRYKMNGVDFFVNTMVDSNIFGTLMLGSVLPNGHAEIRSQAMMDYANRHDGFWDKALEYSAVGLGFSLDPALPVTGIAGGAAAKGTTMLLSKALMPKVGTSLAQRAVMGGAKGYLARGTVNLAGAIAGGAVNLGLFEGAGEGARQLASGNNIDLGGIWTQTKHGAAMGAGVGVAGSLLGNVSGKLMGKAKAADSVAGMTAAKAGTVVAAPIVEGGVFSSADIYNIYTMSDADFDAMYGQDFDYMDMADGAEKDEARKAARNSAAGDVFGDNVLMMSVMKAQNAVLHAGGGKGKSYLSRFKDARRAFSQSGNEGGVKGALEAFFADGKRYGLSLRERIKEHLGREDMIGLTKAEIDELRQYGYTDLSEMFVKNPRVSEVTADSEKGIDVETGTVKRDTLELADGSSWVRSETFESDGSTEGDPYRDYQRLSELMDDSRVAESVKQKLQYITFGVCSPLSTVAGVRNYRKEDGTYVVETLASDNNTIVTRNEYKDKKQADRALNDAMRQVELNTIELGEKAQPATDLHQRMWWASRRVAAKYDWDAETVLKTFEDIMEIRLRGSDKELTGQQRSIVQKMDEELERSKPRDLASELRESIRKETGIDVDKALRKEIQNRNAAEKDAIRKYAEGLYRNDVEFRYSEPEQKQIAAESWMPGNGQESTPEQAEAQSQYDQGRDLYGRAEEGDPDAQADVDAIALRMQEAYQVVEDAFGSESEYYMFRVNENPWSLVDDPELTAGQKDAVLYYINAKAALDGVMDASNESADRKRTEVEESIAKRTHRENGVIIPATMKVDDRLVYIVKGDVVMFPDGTAVDVRNSSESVIVMDLQTGEYEFTSPDQISRVFEAVNPQDEVRTAHEIIEQQQYVPRGIKAEVIATADVFADADRPSTADESEVYDVRDVSDSGDVSALGRIPINEQGEPMFEAAPDKDTAWDGLVEAVGGEADAVDIAMAQVQQATYDLEALKKKPPTQKAPKLKGSPMAMAQAKREAAELYQRELSQYNQQIADTQARLDAWNGIIGVYTFRNAELRRQQEEERRQRDAEAHDAAVARFEEEQRIKAEKQAEQERIGVHAVNPKIKDKWDAAPKVEGNIDAITLPDGSTLTGRYVLTEAGAVSPSHDVNNAYQPTEGFPIDENGQSVNDRDYMRDKDAQQKVEDMAGNYDNRALQDPVIVSRDGVVMSGNNRTMSGDLAAGRGTDKAYIDYLARFGHKKFGFTPEQVTGMKNPRVVFVPDETLPYDATTFARFNAQEKKSQGKPEAAVKLGKIVPDNVFNSIAGDISRYDRLSDYYADEKAVAQALGALMQSGVINDMQMPELRTGTALSATGRELIENTLIGKAFQTSPDAVRQIISTPALRQAVVLGLNEIALNHTLNRSGYDVSEELAKAIDLVIQAKAAMPDVYTEGMPVSSFGRQQGLFDDEFGDSRVTDATTLLLADILNSGRPSDLRKILTTYNNEASQASGGQMDMFSGSIPTKEEILTTVNEHFRNATPKEQQALVDAAILRRREAASRSAAEADAEQRERSEASEQTPNDDERSAVPQQPTADGGTELEPLAKDRNDIHEDTPEEAALRARISVGDEWEEKGPAPDKPIYKRKLYVDGKYEVIQTDAPDKNGSYTGSQLTFDSRNFGDLKEIADYIDGGMQAQQAEPTEAQKAAGNYKMEHRRVDGYNISIENAKGSVRRGTGADGKQWETVMQNDYGYIRGTEGVDGDHIDVFLSDTPEEGDVFVVDQVNEDGSFDEHKVMYGFPTEQAARDAYLSNYEPGWTGLGAITHVSKDEFKKWIQSSRRKTKPFAEYKSVKPIEGNGMIGRSLTEKEATELIARMESSAEVAPTIELTPENWIAQFGEDGTVETPIGIVKMGANQLLKLYSLKRTEYFGMIYPTLNSPDVIIEKNAPADGAERDSKYLFVKTFIKSDGSRLVHFESVTVQRDGMEVSISSHEAEGKAIKKEMQNGNILHLSESLSPSSERYLTEAPSESEGPDLVPTSDNIVKGEEREDGQLLILPSESSEEAGTLSGPTLDSPTDRKVNTLPADKQAESAESFEPYTITATTYTNKKGKTSDVHLVKFNRELTSEEKAALDTFIREPLTEGKKTSRGWYDRKQGGYMMRSEEAARQLAEMIGNEEAVAYAQPMTAEELREAVAPAASAEKKPARKPKKAPINRVSLEDVMTDLSTKGETKLSDHAEPVKSVEYKEGDIVELTTGDRFVIRHIRPNGTIHGRYVQSKLHGNDVSGLRPEKIKRVLESAEKEPEAQHEISDDEMQSLANELRDLLGIGEDEGDTNIRFRDPGELTPQERQRIQSAGIRLAMGLVERGTTSFPDYATKMVGLLGDKIRPWLKSFYEGARWTPGYEKYAFTPTEQVATFDVQNFDKKQSDPIAQAAMIVEERKAATASEQAKKELIETRNKNRRENDKQREADTAALAEKADAVAGEAEVTAQSAGTGEAGRKRILRDLKRVDDTLEEVNDQLALLGYYEAEEVDKDFNEAYGYMRNAEKKAVKDAVDLAKQLVNDLGLGLDKVTGATTANRGKRKNAVTANIAPAGGDISIRLPLNEGRELYITIGLDPSVTPGDVTYSGDNLQATRIMYRVEWPDEKGHVSFDRMGRNCWADANVTYADLLKGIQHEAKEYLPSSTPAEAEETHNGYKIGDEVMWDRYDNGKWEKVKIEDFDADGSPIFEAVKGIMSEKGDWSRVKPANGIFGEAQRVARTEQEKKKSATPAKKKSSVKPEQPVADLFGGLFDEPISNEKKTDVQPRPGTAERERGHEPQSHEPLGESQRIEVKGTDGRGMGGRSSVNPMSDGERGAGVSRKPKSQPVAEPLPESERKNVRNNHAERGVDYAPKGEDARIKANMDAIELAKRLLDAGETAMPEQMAVLRKFSGWGGLGKAFNEQGYTPNPIAKRLKELLGEDGYQDAVDSRRSAYYTPAEVIDTMWDVARAMGFKGAIADSIMNGSKMMQNSMENRVLEEEEDSFGDMTAQLSGSEYAILKNQAEREVRNLTAKQKGHDLDQIYVHNQLPKVEGFIKGAERRIEIETKNLEIIGSHFPDGTIKKITIGKLTFDSVAAMEDFFKEQNAKMNEAAENVREGADNYISKLVVDVDGLKFEVTTTVSRTVDSKGQGTLTFEPERNVTYSCEELGIKGQSIKGNRLKNIMQKISEDIVTGRESRELLSRGQQQLAHYTEERTQLEQRNGREFPYKKELAEAKERLAKYEEAMKKELAEKEAKYAELDKSVETASDITLTDEDSTDTPTTGDGNKYRLVAERELLDFLDAQPLKKGYRYSQWANMGVLPPMTAKQNGEWRAPMIFSRWEQSEEGMRKENGKADLVQGNGRTTGDVAYNPYFHIRTSPLNDQFTAAYDRPELLVVEGYYPESEETSGYQAEGAKDSVGLMDWHSGSVNGQLSDDTKVQTMLSRYFKPGRIVPWSEVADLIMERVGDQKITFPINAVPPMLRAELAKRGAKFGDISGSVAEADIPMLNELRDRVNAGEWDAGLEKARAYLDAYESSTEAKEARVADLSARANTPVRIVRTQEEADALHTRRERRAKGWWSAKDDEVVIVLPNNVNVADVDNTFVHEVAGHKGLRALIGEERFDEFLGEIYDHASNPIRKVIDKMTDRMVSDEADRLRVRKAQAHERAGEDVNANYYTDMAEARVEAEKKREEFRKEATEEYMSDLGGRIGSEGFEKMSRDELTLWGKIKAKVQAFLDKFLQGLKIAKSIRLNDKDLSYILYKSWKNLRKKGVFADAEDAVMRRRTGWDDGMIVSEKHVRIDRLRRSESVEVTDAMIPKGVDLTDRKAVQKSLRETIRGVYVNEHDGRSLEVSGRGINEVTHHGMTDEAHVRSLYAIPEMLRKSTYVDSRRNEKGKNEFDEYRYYVCGLKIDGDDYTAKIVVGVKNGHSYYDHRLSHIEKGKLIDSLNAFSNGVAENESPSDDYKGMTLERLLQIEDEKAVMRKRTGWDEAMLSETAKLEDVNNRFNRELQNQIEGTLPNGHIYQLGNPGTILRSTGVPNLPIQMSATRLRVKATEYGHDFELAEIKNLVKELQTPMAVFAYGDKGKMQNIIVGIESNGKQFIVGLSLNPIVNGKALEINSIRNVFPKNNAEWLNWISQGKLLYADKQKIQALINKQRTILADVAYLDLEDVAKIINSFENPTFDEENTIRYRDGKDYVERTSGMARAMYEKRVQSNMYQATEAMQDSMLGLKEFYKAVESQGGKRDIDDVSSFENAYVAENVLSSTNYAQTSEFEYRIMQPVLDIAAHMSGNKKGQQELIDYMMAKHGLERNAYMRQEAIVNKEDGERDFAGLCGLTGESDWQGAENVARQMVDDYESAHKPYIDEFWKAVNLATKTSLKKVYDSGLLGKAEYEKIRDMYDYYVPLRGFDENTSDDVYGYLTSKGGAFSSPIKKARGRKSKADDPLATIAYMGQNSIIQGNRNRMKQKFLNYVLNHPSDLASVSRLWLRYDDVKDAWIPVTADIDEHMSPDEIVQEVADFEQRMEALAQSEPDRYKRGRDAIGIPYRLVDGNLKEHQVVVKRNGESYVITINGNPRAAQALNGLTNPDNDLNGAVGKIFNMASTVNRHLSNVYTTRNPDFVISNFIRDMLYANAMVHVKEGQGYAMRFHANHVKVNPVVMVKLLHLYERDRLDMSKPLHRMFYEFMHWGGETGYTMLRDMDQEKKLVTALIKDARRGMLNPKKVLGLIGSKLDQVNRGVENSARFAAYITSRQSGRDVQRSVYDAKEISVNFNKKGAGSKFMDAKGQTAFGKTAAFTSGLGRSFYVFWNAAVQGTSNFAKISKKNPKKAIIATSALMLLGYVLAALMDDGDDEDKNGYYNIPKYIRRSNLMFRAGDSWATIPLPVEFRALYGLGELTYGVTSGREEYADGELAVEISSQLSQILPLDFLEGGGGLHAFVPSAFKPIVETATNTSWTGQPIYRDTPFNKDDPEWTKAYPRTNTQLVDLAKWANEATGGNDYKKGWLDINPAQLEYLLNGYLGGYANIVNKMVKTGETMLGDREYDPSNILIVNRLVKQGDERTEEKKLNEDFYKYLEEYRSTHRLLRKYEDEADRGSDKYRIYLDALRHSRDGARHDVMDEYIADYNWLNKAIKDPEITEEERSMYEEEMRRLKREAVSLMKVAPDSVQMNRLRKQFSREYTQQ